MGSVSSVPRERSLPNFCRVLAGSMALELRTHVVQVAERFCDLKRVFFLES